MNESELYENLAVIDQQTRDTYDLEPRADAHYLRTLSGPQGPVQLPQSHLEDTSLAPYHLMPGEIAALRELPSSFQPVLQDYIEAADIVARYKQLSHQSDLTRSALGNLRHTMLTSRAAEERLAQHIENLYGDNAMKAMSAYYEIRNTEGYTAANYILEHTPEQFGALNETLAHAGSPSYQFSNVVVDAATNSAATYKDALDHARQTLGLDSTQTAHDVIRTCVQHLEAARSTVESMETRMRELQPQVEQAKTIMANMTEHQREKLATKLPALQPIARVGQAHRRELELKAQEKSKKRGLGL